MIAPPPRPPASTTHVAIVGAGIAGLALAWRLVERGAQVTLLDGGHGGASRVPVALINPFRGRSGRPGRFDVAGAREFWRLAAQLGEQGIDPGAERSGVLRVASNESQVRSWRSHEGLEEMAEVPPGLAGAAGVFLAPLGGYVVPGRMLAGLRELLTDRGVDLLDDTPVTRVSRSGSGWQLWTARGSLQATRVVLATGASPLPEIEGVPGGLGGDFEVNLGEVVELRGPDAPRVDLPRPVAGPVYLAKVGYSVYVGGNRRGPDREDTKVAQLLRESAVRMVPALAGWQVASVWSGRRLRHLGNEPQCLQLAPGLWFLGAFGGRGFLTAALFARLLARRLMALRDD